MQPYLVNMDKQHDKDMPAGGILVGFGRGKLKLSSGAPVIGDVRVCGFVVVGGTDMVVHNSEFTRLKAVVDTKRKSDPLAKVAYHKREEAPGEENELGAFNLHVEYTVYFLPTPRPWMRRGTQMAMTRLERWRRTAMWKIRLYIMPLQR